MSRRKRRIAIVAVAIMAIAAFAYVFWPRDAQRFQGTWTGSGGRLTVDGDLMVLDLPGGPASRWYFSLDPSASPKRITVWDADNPTLVRRRVLGLELGTPRTNNPGFEIHGIYELDGHVLRLCLPLAGADFPTGIDPAAGAVIDFRRE